MSKKSSLILFATVVFTLGALLGCGDRQSDRKSSHPPVPDNPKGGGDIQGSPLFLFNQGGGRLGPGEDDPAYQEYLLWKEWQEYQKYQEWLRNNPDAQPVNQTGE
ncbi:MAG: hypothetical protein OXI60_11175 [Acidiferrobacterales bacterium]|nr:hypothetical protein [Acidiferrobacterales bacterium]